MNLKRYLIHVFVSGSDVLSDDSSSDVEPAGTDSENSVRSSATDGVSENDNDTASDSDTKCLQRQDSNILPPSQSFIFSDGETSQSVPTVEEDTKENDFACQAEDDCILWNDEDEDVITSNIWKNCDDDQLSDDDCQECKFSYEDDNPIYKGAPLKVSESMTAILTYITKHELDGRAIVDLLNLINLHCIEEDNEMKTSLYLFKKYFEGLNSPVIYHYFCSCCFTELSKNNLICPNLKLHPGNKGTSIFVEVPLERQLQRLFSQEEFFKNLSYKNNRKKINENNLEDIYDGQLYKELVQEGFLNASNPLNFSMMLNADGVPVFKSSKKSLWPFFFSILELPPHLRFKKEFTLIGGLWFGGKPMVNIILGKLLPSLKTIRTGFKVQPFGTNKTEIAKGVVLAATADLPAKAMLLGMQGHSGAFSCHVCKIKGESVKIEKPKKKGKKGKTKKGAQAADGENLEEKQSKESSVWVFRYEKERDLRRHKETVDHGKEVQDIINKTGNEKSHVLGVKFPSVLFKIMYDTIRGFGIDDLHTIYLGNIKTLVKLWFDSNTAVNHFQLGNIYRLLIVDWLLLNLLIFWSAVSEVLMKNFPTGMEMNARLGPISLPFLF
ncbi:uncharacterized protein LOC127750497 [Frankliniella occidentalis]|uniref:Uncharacterized protein LOC127750497 n=1 Tax=Frankliniella occidentalis TaxID=133901 RepID=A0A9C6X348_FRAOC|nr:uncharacterized protein LOC127750497 [Frankliniella occidentalis]